jgi:hypothetical protein
LVDAGLKVSGISRRDYILLLVAFLLGGGALVFAGVAALVFGFALVFASTGAFVGFLGFFFTESRGGGGDKGGDRDQGNDFFHGAFSVVDLFTRGWCDISPAPPAGKPEISLRKLFTGYSMQNWARRVKK